MKLKIKRYWIWHGMKTRIISLWGSVTAPWQWLISWGSMDKKEIGNYSMNNKRPTRLIALYGKTISLETLSHLVDRSALLRYGMLL